MKPFYVLDRVSLKPGQLGAYRDLWRDRYLPGARERGMELVGTWVSPPVEIAEGNEMFVLWSLPDDEAFWTMRTQAGADPAVGAYWADVDRLAVERERRFLRSAEEL